MTRRRWVPPRRSRTAWATWTGTRYLRSTRVSCAAEAITSGKVTGLSRETSNGMPRVSVSAGTVRRLQPVVVVRRGRSRPWWCHLGLLDGVADDDPRGVADVVDVLDRDTDGSGAQPGSHPRGHIGRSGKRTVQHHPHRLGRGYCAGLVDQPHRTEQY